MFEKLSKKIEVFLVKELKEGVEVDYGVDVIEGVVWKYDRVYELEEEKVRKVEFCVVKLLEKERG